MRALRFDFTRRPSPGSTNTPFFLVSLNRYFCELFENRCGLFVAEFMLLSHVTDELGLGHACCHS